MGQLQLTSQQRTFIDTFGYLVFPGLLRERIERILGNWSGPNGPTA